VTLGQNEAPLLGPGVKRRAPLIPSAPRSDKKPSTSSSASTQKKKAFTKPQLNKYRSLLYAKRRELLGDIENLESEALMGAGGGETHTPQNTTDQGGDSYDAALSLDLAAADRRLIREIDDALGRIEAGTFGLCEMTGKPINPARLEELPWARYSIEAARAMERRGGV
tara:strand:- start:63 stop:566 length:504 start_codon:yes stop_codon:yes gene_type:complete